MIKSINLRIMPHDTSLKPWGPQTDAAIRHFAIGNETMPHDIIKAIAIIKKAAAKINYKLTYLSNAQKDAIISIADRIISGELQQYFPISIWQSGSGTQTNMNVNEMDGMFVDSADERRRFLDSAVYCFMKEHREHCAKYKHYVKSRLHLLKLGDYNDVWMSSIEKSIAQLSVKIDVARSIVVRILSDSMQDIAWEDVCLVMRSSLSSEFGMHDITIEELRKYDDAGFADEIKHVEEQFYFRREKDARSGVSTFGAHRSDFSMMLRGNDVSRCSTGEQKRSLLILIMAKARIIPNVCVLLDDTLAHLDPDMQRSILEMLDKTEAQIFMTSASMEHYECAAKYVRDVDIWRI